MSFMRYYVLESRISMGNGHHIRYKECQVFSQSKFSLTLHVGEKDVSIFSTMGEMYRKLTGRAVKRQR